MGTLMEMTGYEEEERLRSINRITTFLVLGFLFPLYIPGFQSGKLTFVNIEYIGKGDILTTL
ncbi:MAG: hypothetical protein GY950_04755, partial [bacterium]|nr:hypothetical protein [bacterium]